MFVLLPFASTGLGSRFHLVLASGDDMQSLASMLLIFVCVGNGPIQSLFAGQRLPVFWSGVLGRVCHQSLGGICGAVHLLAFTPVFDGLDD